MKNSLSVLVLYFISQLTLAQSKLGNQWIVGTLGYKIDFNTSSIIHDTAILSPILVYQNGQSNICDTNGNLVLCSNGLNISNHTGAFIDGGDTLASPFFYNFSGSDSRYSQSSIFLPMADEMYYLVTPIANDTMVNNYWLAGINGNFNILNYHVIDMKANGGAGKVVKRMQPLLQNRWMDKTQMMACRHANGKDWWLLKKAGILGNDSNAIFTFLFTQDSVYDYGIQTIPFPRNEAFPQDFPGQMKFNQSGTQMATVANSWLHEMYLSDFDRCTGKLSNFKKIKVPIWGGDSSSTGLEFSPNGRFLYVMQYSNIFQYDLQDTNQTTAWFHVHGPDTTASEFAYYTTIDLAPNNKMYIGHYHGTSRQMSVIDNPDMKGNWCNFCRKCLRNIATYSYFGTAPTMPNYNLGEQTPCWPLDVADEVQANADAIKLYPNPASTKIFIEYSLNPNETGQLSIYDILGRRLHSIHLSASLNRMELPIASYANGIYSYKYDINGKKAASGKFIKE
jgi:hypothetical protein